LLDGFHRGLVKAHWQTIEQFLSIRLPPCKNPYPIGAWQPNLKPHLCADFSQNGLDLQGFSEIIFIWVIILFGLNILRDGLGLLR
jgi:hypothetical protein